MSRPIKIAVGLAVFIIALILVSQCAFNAGEWVGRH